MTRKCQFPVSSFNSTLPQDAPVTRIDAGVVETLGGRGGRVLVFMGYEATSGGVVASPTTEAATLLEAA